MNRGVDAHDVEQGVVFVLFVRKLGPGASSTLIQFPFLSGNYLEIVSYWWNVVFWNASVQRAAV